MVVHKCVSLSPSRKIKKERVCFVSFFGFSGQGFSVALAVLELAWWTQNHRDPLASASASWVLGLNVWSHHCSVRRRHLYLMILRPIAYFKTNYFLSFVAFLYVNGKLWSIKSRNSEENDYRERVWSLGDLEAVFKHYFPYTNPMVKQLSLCFHEFLPLDSGKCLHFKAKAAHTQIALIKP